MSDTADFNFYINQEGPRGPKGEKGDKGFSPNISVYSDTLSEYILKITNENGFFLTTNLREHKEDRGGTYIRYDRNTGAQYAGSADQASETAYGEVRFATQQEVDTASESTVISPANMVDYLDTNIKPEIQSIQDSLNLKLEAANIIQGQNITLNKQGNNITINATSDNNYNNTSNKPQINGVELVGNKNGNDLGLANESEIEELGNKLNQLTSDVTNLGNTKQDKLTAGNNIIIEGNVISSTNSGETENINLYRLEFGTTYSSPPVLFDNNTITIKAGTLVNTPNGEFTYSKDITYNYKFTTDRTIFAFKNNSQEDYYNMVDVFYGGSQPSPDNRGQIAWFDNGVWKMISSDGTITTFETELVTPIAKVFLNSNYNIENIDYGSYSKIPTGTGDVTAAGDNTFTGTNTFNGSTTVNSYNFKVTTNPNIGSSARVFNHIGGGPSANKPRIGGEDIPVYLDGANVIAEIDNGDGTQSDVPIQSIYEAAMSGGGGTGDYNDLRNIPQINGVELKGNLTSADLNIPINTISINGGGAESTNYITYYTAVGNPTISEDFIMTGANQSNYLNCDFKPPSAINSFIFEGEFVVSENAILEASHQAIFGQQVDTTNRTSPQLEVITNPDTSSQDNNQIAFLPPISSSNWGDTIRHYITDISKFPGTWYYKYTFNNQSQTVIGHIENLTNGYKPDDITISQSVVYWISPLSIGADSGAEHTSNNISIDLKSFKVNINDSVINYQAAQIL